MATERKIPSINLFSISFHTTKLQNCSSISIMFKCKIEPTLEDNYQYCFDKVMHQIKYKIHTLLKETDMFNTHFIIMPDVSIDYLAPHKKSAMTIDIALNYIKDSKLRKATVTQISHMIAKDMEECFGHSIFQVS